MKILLVNTNQYKNPPVIPIGLEYLIKPLIDNNHTVSVLDMTFIEKPLNELDNRIKDFEPHIIGLSIRQLDTVLYKNNETFFDNIKSIISVCRNNNKKVILGGPGFSCMYKNAFSFFEADYAIYGPGEQALPQLLNQIKNKKVNNCLINGYEYGINNKTQPLRAEYINYDEYIDNEGIVGFSTQTGCYGDCYYCPENSKNVLKRKPSIVAEEIKLLTDKGFFDYHLCDSEFNQDLDHSINICKAIIEKCPKIRWTAYLRNEPYSDELIKLMMKSGVFLITISLDSKPKIPYDLDRLASLFNLAQQYNIKMAVDLLTGFPNEDIKDAAKFFDFLKKQPLSTVGINNYFRIYSDTEFEDEVNTDPELKKKLIYNTKFNEDYKFLYPSYYNNFANKQIKEIIGDCSFMNLEDSELSSNYHRV